MNLGAAEEDTAFMGLGLAWVCGLKLCRVGLEEDGCHDPRHGKDHDPCDRSPMVTFLVWV